MKVLGALNANAEADAARRRMDAALESFMVVRLLFYFVLWILDCVRNERKPMIAECRLFRKSVPSNHQPSTISHQPSTIQIYSSKIFSSSANDWIREE
eukprot:scaffold3074_cov280-Chaetoceros_neogracile.AAC.28